jgi:hypothetical protein
VSYNALLAGAEIRSQARQTPTNAKASPGSVRLGFLPDRGADIEARARRPAAGQ